MKLHNRNNQNSEEMGNFFNPGDARYRRIVTLTSIYASAAVAVHTIMIDFGKQEHIFTGIQRYITKKVDNYYEITEEEILKEPSPNDAVVPKEVKHSIFPTISIKTIEKPK